MSVTSSSSSSSPDANNKSKYVSVGLLLGGTFFLGLGFYWHAEKEKDEELAAVRGTELSFYRKYRSGTSMFVGTVLLLVGVFLMFKGPKKTQEEEHHSSRAAAEEEEAIVMQSAHADRQSPPGRRQWIQDRWSSAKNRPTVVKNREWLAARPRRQAPAPPPPPPPVMMHRTPDSDTSASSD